MMNRPEWLDSPYSRDLFARVGINPDSLPMLAGIAEDEGDIVIWFDTDDAVVRFPGAA